MMISAAINISKLRRIITDDKGNSDRLTDPVVEEVGSAVTLYLYMNLMI